MAFKNPNLGLIEKFGHIILIQLFFRKEQQKVVSWHTYVLGFILSKPMYVMTTTSLFGFLFIATVMYKNDKTEVRRRGRG
jgi:hypothetical protein